MLLATPPRRMVGGTVHAIESVDSDSRTGTSGNDDDDDDANRKPPSSRSKETEHRDSAAPHPLKVKYESIVMASLCIRLMPARRARSAWSLFVAEYKHGHPQTSSAGSTSRRLSVALLIADHTTQIFRKRRRQRGMHSQPGTSPD